MGTWGDGLFDDDLALDIWAHFEQTVAKGTSAAEAAKGLMESELAREILEEFGTTERDDMFWEENRGLFYAIASIQLEHGVLQEVIRQQTLQAIAVERRGLDPEQDQARWERLDAFEARLGSGEPAPARPAEGAGTEATADLAALGVEATADLAALGVEATMAKPPAKKAAAKKPAKKAAAKKPTKKAPTKQSTARKPTARKPTARKPTARKPTARKPTARKPTAKGTPAKKSTAKKAARPAAKKTAASKATRTR
jgi:hypothetical protein